MTGKIRRGKKRSEGKKKNVTVKNRRGLRDLWSKRERRNKDTEKWFIGEINRAEEKRGQGGGKNGEREIKNRLGERPNTKKKKNQKEKKKERRQNQLQK